MPFATYQELQNEIAGWLGDRTDLLPQIPSFIALCEASISGYVRCRETHERALAVLNEEYEWLPSDFAAMDYVAFGSGNGDRVRLPYKTMEQIDALGVSGNQTAAPCAVTTVGKQLRFYPPPTPLVIPDGVDPDLTPQKCRHFEVVYWTKVLALGPDADSTNDVLLNYPDIYLFGSLIKAEPYILNDARLDLWKSEYADAVDRANGMEKGGSLAALTISTPGDCP